MREGEDQRIIVTTDLDADGDFYEANEESAEDGDIDSPKKTSSRYAKSARKRSPGKDDKREKSEEKVMRSRMDPEQYFKLTTDALTELFYLLKDDRRAMNSF